MDKSLFTITNIRETILNTDPHFWVRYGGLLDKVANTIWDEYKGWKIITIDTELANRVWRALQDHCQTDGSDYTKETRNLFMAAVTKMEHK